MIMHKISVIIPTYNSWNTLKSCIASIQNQTLKSREIIVVNNGSSDGTAEKVKGAFPKINLINLKTNTGVTGGRNKGIEVAKKNSDFLFFFDHDMVADKRMLEELVKVGLMSKDIGIVTPKTNYYENKKRIWSAGTGINLWTGQVLFRGGMDVGQYEKIEEVEVAPAAMLVKRELLRKIKSFDDIFFATYEDTDFCFRAKHFGYKTYYAPKALAFHRLPLDFYEESRRLLSRSYWIGRNRVIFMKKYGNNFFVFLLFLPIFSVYYLNLSIRLKQISSWFKFLLGTINGILR